MTSTEQSLADGWASLPDLADPYPFLARLRAEAPVFRTPDGVWFVTDYGLVSEIGRAPGLWASNFMKHAQGAGSDPYLNDPDHGLFAQVYQSILMFQDGAAHRRLRRLSQPVFSPRRLEQFRAQVRREIDRQLETAISRAGETRTMDLIDSFTLPMPTRIILDMFGLPVTEAPRFDEMTRVIIPPIDRGSPDQWFAHADEVFGRHAPYILDVAAERRAGVGQDLLTLIAQATDDDGRPLSNVELVGFVAFLVTAGYETTANTFSTGLYWLLRHPEQFARLRGDPNLIPSAVEEMLRFDPATKNAGPRFATEDTVLGGQHIKRGDRVLPSILAANRDPSRFADPDRFDIARSPNQHLSFYAGPHACLGMPLARIELQEGLRSVIANLPELRLSSDTPPAWHRSLMIRALEALPVTW